MLKTNLFLFAMTVVLCAVNAEVPVCPQYLSDPNEIMYLADGDDCSAYYQCSNGKAYLMHCPAGLVYDIELQTCNYKESVDCTWRLEPAEPVPIRTTITYNN